MQKPPPRRGGGGPVAPSLGFPFGTWEARAYQRPGTSVIDPRVVLASRPGSPCLESEALPLAPRPRTGPRTGAPPSFCVMLSIVSRIWSRMLGGRDSSITSRAAPIRYAMASPFNLVNSGANASAQRDFVDVGS